MAIEAEVLEGPRAALEVVGPPLGLEDEFAIPEIEGAREADQAIKVYPPLGLLNVLSQQRQGSNARQAELTANIEAEGLHYGIDITLVDGQMLKEYLEFTNRVWNKEKKIEEFKPCGPDRYLLVIAGHSRKISLHNIARKHGIDEMEFPAKCELRPVDSIEKFIAIQLRENIHSSPPPERAARAYAEAFLYTRERNPKLTMKDFADAHGIPKGQLRDALYYVELPESLRELTDNGELPFKVGIELAKALPWIRKESEASVEARGFTGEEFDAEFERRVSMELLRYVAMHTGQHNGNVTATTARIKEDVRAIKKDLGVDDSTSEESLQLVLLDARAMDKTATQLFEETRGFSKRYATQHGVATTGLHNRVTELTRQPELTIDPEADVALVGVATHVARSAKQKAIDLDAGATTPQPEEQAPQLL